MFSLGWMEISIILIITIVVVGPKEIPTVIRFIKGMTSGIRKMSKEFTKYAWDKNAGYGTKLHLKAIKKFGVTKHHRKTFSPIHNILSPN